MSYQDDPLAYNRQLVADFRAQRAHPGGPMPGRHLLLLTTTGARSGQPRTTPMMYVPEGDRLLVIASNAGAPTHPAWWLFRRTRDRESGQRCTVSRGRPAVPFIARRARQRAAHGWW